MRTRIAEVAVPARRIRWVAWAAAAWCVGFAVVNVVLEASGRFDQGPLAGYAAGLAVMGWIVVALKLLGAAAAVLTVYDPPRRVPVGVRLLLIWGAFALLALYSAGNLVLTGRLLVTDPGSITVRSLGYLGFFLAGVTVFGVLAVSYYRRAGRDRRFAVAGALGAPVLLALVLLAAPAVLTAVGLLPA